jgi:hypothetical protein
MPGTTSMRMLTNGSCPSCWRIWARSGCTAAVRATRVSTARLVAAGLAAAALVASGCGATRPRESAAERECIGRFRTPPGHPSRSRVLERPSTHVFLRLAQEGQPWRTNFDRHLVSLCEFVSGGVPRDTIPAINRPRVASVAAATRELAPGEPVVVVAGRAYPLRILLWHEVVNDVIGGRPVVVTYCPLCNTAQAFDRRVRGRTLAFGVSGVLRGGDLVMFDRATQSWWQQFDGRALVGSLAGAKLRLLPAVTARFAAFRRHHPHGEVLSQRTGFDRPYGRTPYPRYDHPSTPPRGLRLHPTPGWRRRRQWRYFTRTGSRSQSRSTASAGNTR